MPLFMDVHDITGGVAVEDVAQAHLADLQTQAAHDVRYLRCWVDEQAAGCSAWPRLHRRTPPPRSTARPTA